jgi:uncharacterized protein YjbJ (UPF0337 family)
MADRTEELKGRVKEGVGKVTGDQKLEAEGKGQAEGSRAKRKIEGTLDEVGGVIKETVGKVTGNKVTEAEGKADRFEGKAERAG